MTKATTHSAGKGIATSLTVVGLVLGALFAGLPVLWLFAAS